MTKDQFSQAFFLAKSDRHFAEDPTALFNGFGLPGFQPVTVTIEAVAALIRWQAFEIFGGIDHEALNEVAKAGRRKFLIAG
jgi:hypothetical protein